MSCKLPFGCDLEFFMLIPPHVSLGVTGSILKAILGICADNNLVYRCHILGLGGLIVGMVRLDEVVE